MRNVSFIARTSLALTAAAFCAGTADAALVVFDTFGASAQSVVAAGSLTQNTAAASGTSATSASIAAVAGSRNSRQARADWATGSTASALTDADKTGRSASTVIDTAAGVARMGFGGRVSSANASLTYASQVGGVMDFSGYDTLFLDGALTNVSGLGQTSVLTLDIVLIDANGINASTYFGAGDANGGLTGLNGLLSANLADFFSFDPNGFGSTPLIDLSQIVSFSLTLGYYDGSFNAPSAGATYELGQISFNAVPAPGAIALLAAAGMMGWTRRRT